MKVPLEIVVRSTEIDVNGHVNNAKYLEYLEWGREEWYEQVGLSYETFLKLGIQTVTVNISINYRKECRQGDRLTIVTEPMRLGNTSFVLLQTITNHANEVVADATVTSVTMDATTRKARQVPDNLAPWFQTNENPQS